MTASEVAARIPGARAYGNGFRSPAPCHGSRSATLSIREGRDGRVLVRCFAGCDLQTITRAIGLDVRDLFAATSRDDGRARAVFARSQPVDRRQALKTFLSDEVERQRIARIASAPFDTPCIRSRDVNRARERASSIFGVVLEPIPRYTWEGFSPHDADPQWPVFFARAVDELAWELAHFRDPSADPWVTCVPPPFIFPMAADRAATWLRNEVALSVRWAA